jgi:hypothetical protein
MRTKRAKAKPIVYENAPEHPYKKYESHPYWKRIDRGIADLVENQDVVERAARPYIVGYLCKMILQRKEGRKQAEPAYCYPIVRLPLPGQTVDATPSNQLMRQCFPSRSDLLAILGENLARVVFRLI